MQKNNFLFYLKNFFIFLSTFSIYAESLTTTQSHLLGRFLEQRQLSSQESLPVLSDFLFYQLLKIVDASDKVFDSKIRFMIVDDPSINAFATEGNFIFLMKGMIEHNPDITNLLTILSHELGHSYHHHVNQQISFHSRQANNELLYLAMLPLLVTSPSLALILSELTLHQQLERQGSFSQSNELEADKFSFDLMVAGGFDPQIPSESLTQSIGVTERENFKFHIKGFEKYSTHPMTSARVQQLTDMAKELKDCPDKNFNDIAPLQKDFLRLFALSVSENKWPNFSDKDFMHQALENRNNISYWEQLFEQEGSEAAFFMLCYLYREQENLNKLWPLVSGFENKTLKRIEHIENILVDQDRNILPNRSFIRRYQQFLFSDNLDTNPYIMAHLAELYEEENNEIYSRLALAKMYLLQGKYEEGIRIFQHFGKLKEHPIGEQIHLKLSYMNDKLREFAGA